MARFTYVLCALALAAVAAGTRAEARGALSHQRMLRTDGQAAGQAVAPMPTAIDAKLSLANISGVWVGVADQYHSGVWAAYFKEGALPDCDADAPHPFTYQHWGPELPDSVALAADGTGINGHETGTYVWSEVTFDGTHLRYRPDWAPEEVSCALMVPYIDARSGMVFASVVTKTEWKKTAEGVDTVDVSCNLKSFEEAGCHAKGADTVHSVAVTTYRCMAGTCAGYAPAIAEKLAKEEGK